MSPVTAFRTRSLASLAFANQRLPDNGAIRQKIGLRRNPEKNGSRWRKVQSGWNRRRMNRSEEHTSELQSLMRISYAVFCLKKKKNKQTDTHTQVIHTTHI